MNKISTQSAIDIYDYFKVNFLDKQLVRFTIVGGIAFVTNAIILFIFHGLLSLNLLFSQIVAAEVSIVVSFTIHHHWTYKNYHSKPLYARFLHFNGSALGGIIISTSTLLLCVHILKIHYLFGLVIGAAFAMSWNYFANKYFIWVQTTED